MHPKITIIGSANIDYIMQIPHLPKVGETVTDGKFFQAYGGKGANQAVAAARAGGATTFIAALGNDPAAKDYQRSLEADGIDCTRVSLESDAPTGSALVMFDHRGDNYLTVAPGSNYSVTAERVNEAESIIAASDWIILQQEIPFAANQAVLKLAARHQRPVLLNYAPANDLRLRPDDAVHGLVVNEIEAATLLERAFDSANPPAVAAIAKELLERGQHRFVAVTLGGNGVTLAETSGATHLPAFPITPADATAAGDTFCGALTVALAEGKSLIESARFASAASALTVTRTGAQASIPSRPEIDTFLAEHSTAP